MSKKVIIGVKPMSRPLANVDNWVNGTEESLPEAPSVSTVSMKRLTLDIPDALHRQIKTNCAQRGTKMAEEIRALLEKHYSGSA
jgi:hypothetical protein